MCLLCIFTDFFLFCIFILLLRKFPDYYYALSFPVPGDKKLDIVMLDTVKLCGNTYDDAADQPSGPENVEEAESQSVWLEKQLANSK